MRAEAQAEALAQLVGETLATKQDIRQREYRSTIGLGAMMMVAISAVATVTKVL